MNQSQPLRATALIEEVAPYHRSSNPTQWCEYCDGAGAQANTDQCALERDCHAVGGAALERARIAVAELRHSARCRIAVCTPPNA